MKKESSEKIKKWLVDVLSEEKGYFGKIYTNGLGPKRFEYIGYELSLDIAPTIELLSEKDRKCLIKIILYFEIHANPLKKMIEGDDKLDHYTLYSKWAWSHFMTVVMFGMLEVAAINTPSCIIFKNEKRGFINKIETIKLFLQNNLSQDVRDDIMKRYKTWSGEAFDSFDLVVMHLWEEIRSGFIHEANIDCVGMEWTTFSCDDCTKEGPISLRYEVPMQDLLQMAWQAILNSFGYKGVLNLPKRVIDIK